MSSCILKRMPMRVFWEMEALSCWARLAMIVKNNSTINGDIVGEGIGADNDSFCLHQE